MTVRPVAGVWLPPEALVARRAAASGPLAPLTASLSSDLEPFLDVDLALPPEKARLSRMGGRCPRDGTPLRFDPRSPRSHLCPRCGRTFTDDAHYRWWIMGFHLWLAERAVHAAALHALRGDERHRRFACDVLIRYADSYLGYPNADNVLGPTRLFFSTYLESLWLLHVCTALDLLETVGAAGSLGARLRDQLVEPSAELIASYDERLSNRQVWNDAALLAAHISLGRPERCAPIVWGPSGIVALLSSSLLADGTWYEGENYHQFAHRGLWYGVQLVRATGLGELPGELTGRFDAGFAAPFLTALPDLTAPSRRDSQYAVSLRQWRFAEMAELGLARNPDDRELRSALGLLYDGRARLSDSGRWRSTGEAERNESAVALDRSSLGWRSLLFALPELPPLTGVVPRSVLLEGQGLAVLRRQSGRVYVALDYGVAGGGHGHPDRLGIIYADGEQRWVDDPGTGSYVDPSLHWYRSTLAHCAPLVDGRSQLPANGELLHWDERGGIGWVDALVEGVAPGVVLRRALVVFPDYFVDELSWQAERDVRVELPLQGDLRLEGVERWVAHASDADGAEFLRYVERPSGRDVSTHDGALASVGEQSCTRLSAVGSGRAIAWTTSDTPISWWRAVAPGAPGRPDAPLHVAAVSGRAGTLRTVWSGEAKVRSVGWQDGALHVLLEDGGLHMHRATDNGWHVDLVVNGARSSVDLTGGRERPAAGSVAPSIAGVAARSLATPFVAELGEAEYRRSELSWTEAGCPRAIVRIDASDGVLSIAVEVAREAPHFSHPDARNEMDNERPEINFDGVQLHLVLPDRSSAAEPIPTASWLLTPLSNGELRVLPLDPLSLAIPIRAGWSRSTGGYEVHLRLLARDLRDAHVGPLNVGIGVVVNENVEGRERRRGQLVLGGARGEYVYLRGDRHDAGRCLPFLLPDV